MLSTCHVPRTMGLLGFPEGDTGFDLPVLPEQPTGATITKEQLQGWVDYANHVGAVILFDAAYEAYISEEDVPHSIYECEGARTCAIELRSFSKNAALRERDLDIRSYQRI